MGPLLLVSPSDPFAISQLFSWKLLQTHCLGAVRLSPPLPRPAPAPCDQSRRTSCVSRTGHAPSHLRPRPMLLSPASTCSGLSQGHLLQEAFPATRGPRAPCGPQSCRRPLALFLSSPPGRAPAGWGAASSCRGFSSGRPPCAWDGVEGIMR